MGSESTHIIGFYSSFVRKFRYIVRRGCVEEKDMRFSRSVPATVYLKVWLIVGGWSFVIGCGKEPNIRKQFSDANDTGVEESSKPSHDVTAGRRVYALLGGYLSCKNDKNNAPTLEGSRMALILSDLMAELKSAGKEDPVSLVSCYSWDATNITYSLSSDPTKTVTSTVDEMIANFNSVLAGTKRPKLYMVGHSYGGWTSMKIASTLTAINKMASLITVDPISKVNCTPNTIINYATSKPDDRCKEAPTDFAAQQIEDIASRTNLWLNVYQNDFEALHSGPIAAAQNLLKTYPTSNFSHSAVIDDPDVRENIKKVLTAD